MSRKPRGARAATSLRCSRSTTSPREATTRPSAASTSRVRTVPLSERSIARSYRRPSGTRQGSAGTRECALSLGGFRGVLGWWGGLAALAAVGHFALRGLLVGQGGLRAALTDLRSDLVDVAHLAPVEPAQPACEDPP